MAQRPGSRTPSRLLGEDAARKDYAYGHPCLGFFRSTCSFSLLGLAAASVPKPTVVQYTRYLRYLQVANLAKESEPYGEVSRHEVMIRLDNFPEKGGSMGARRVRKSLKRQHLSSASFTKRGLHWESVLLLVFSPYGVLTVGFGLAAAANPILWTFPMAPLCPAWCRAGRILCTAVLAAVRMAPAS
jgi:hypothetical protein